MFGSSKSIDASILGDINIPNVCVRRKTKRVLYGHGAGTHSECEPSISELAVLFP